ncbi:hypothetical protein [Denitrobaculum tricleocarpae]|uniref:Uncharacterized protein n=1 Tax=Denitrobaculum tricleocarpae TaxID=2591009 RepID=A0A545TYH1_9PROT|nr:hypothetical protein [Denitrobaculum tricleocarpae]TQV82270.1 hypothetical protein FKG95_08620 [Denitrobaculum tricleocarpae]
MNRLAAFALLTPLLACTPIPNGNGAKGVKSVEPTTTFSSLNEAVTRVYYAPTYKSQLTDNGHYAVVQFTIAGLDMNNNDDVKRTFGNMVRRFLTPKSKTVALVVEVHRTNTLTGISTASESSLIGREPIFIIQFDEKENVVRSSAVSATGALTPYIRARSGHTLRVSYSLRSTEGYSSNIIDTFREALTFVSGAAGGQGAWLLNRVTNPTFEDFSKKADNRLGQMLSKDITSKYSEQLDLLGDTSGIKGIKIELKQITDSDATGSINIEINHRRSIFGSDQGRLESLPKIDRDFVTILATNFGPSPNHNLQQYVDQNTDIKNIYRLWQDQFGNDFISTCEYIRMKMVGEVGLNSIDTAVSMWAFLMNNKYYRDSSALQKLDCEGENNKKIRTAIGLNITPTGITQDRELVVSEMNNQLTKLAKLIKSKNSDLIDVVTESIFSKKDLSYQDKTGSSSLNKNPIRLDSAAFVVANLRKFNPSRVGCFLSNPHEHTEIRNLMMLSQDQKLLKLTIGFDRHTPTGEALRIRSAQINEEDGEFLSKVLVDRVPAGVTSLELEQIQPCGKDWKPWAEFSGLVKENAWEKLNKPDPQS